MCRGIEEEEDIKNEDGGCRRLCSEKVRAPVRCELCGDNAAVYCEADSAFLCRKCDRLVHTANFLARRHLRRVLCTDCRKLTRRCLVGDYFSIVLPSTAVEMRRRTESEQDSSNHKVPFVFI